MTEFLKRIRDLIAQRCSGPLLVHADAMRALDAIELVSDVKEILRRHIHALELAADGRELWLPTFNYDFLKTGVYDVTNDKCQVGALNEFARSNWATWRSATPVFNVCGTHAPLPEPDFAQINAFGSDSVFAHLHQRRGAVLFYGAPFISVTASHYIEQHAGGPVYRYDKKFKGHVKLASCQLRDTSLIMHVRPMGTRLTYDVPRLEAELEAEGILIKLVDGGSVVSLVDMSRLFDAWTAKLAADPLYLLDDQTRAWVAPKLDELGRRFLIEDFESL